MYYENEHIMCTEKEQQIMKIPSFNTLATTNLLLIVLVVLIAAAIPTLRLADNAQAQTSINNDPTYKGNAVATRDIAVSEANTKIADAIDRVAETNLEIAKSNTAIAKAILQVATSLDKQPQAAGANSANPAIRTNSGIEVEVGKRAK